MASQLFRASVGAFLSVCLLLLPQGPAARAQETPKLKTENVFLITTDGFRWQELFTGADPELVNNDKFTKDPEALKEQFWRDSPEARREALLPFVWNVVAKQGQLYGNRRLGCSASVTNNMWFSYPGYNEILTGHADDEHINSNKKIPNPNVTVLEFVNQQDGFEGKVAAVASWDVIPFIINPGRSGIPVEVGNPDEKTRELAMKVLKEKSPRLFYVNFLDTDHFAHGGKYDDYLNAAHNVDQFLHDLWDYAQSTPQYRDKTTFIITTDHGRGLGPKWTSHGRKVPNCNEIWIAVLGPDTPAKGEIKTGEYTQSQVARTVAAFLGLDYSGDPEAGPLLKPSIKR